MSMITGAGKDAGAGSVYVAPELVRSIGTARILDLLCEGPIVGLVNGDSSVYLDDTPLRDPVSGVYNFVDKNGAPAVSVSAANVGTPDQPSIPGFDQVESETAVGAEVLHSQPVVRRVETGIDRIRLRLAAPSLYRIDGNGNTLSNKIEYLIDVKDSTMASWPDPATVQAALVSRALTVPMAEVSAPAGYATVFQADLSALNTETQRLTQLSYALDLSVAMQGTVEVWGTEDGASWSLLQSSAYSMRYITKRVVTDGIPSWVIDKVIASTADSVPAYGLVALQFRFEHKVSLRSREPYTWNGASYPGVSGYFFSGVFSSATANYFSIYGPRLTGNHPSKFEISTYDYPLPGVGPWDIRVTKVTEDSGDAKVQQTLSWESYTEIVDSKLSYPNCATVGIVASAQQFSSVPRRGYHCKLLLVQVPSNCFPATRDANGVWTMARYTRNALGQDTGVEQGWDGTFYAAWSSNPAWCYYDMVVKARYGLGRYVSPASVDKWSLYTIGRYCDGAVDSGYRSAAGAVLYEPRFTLNCYITNRGQAYALLQSLAQVFRGMVYWAAGKVTATQDAPADPVHEFTNANVVDGVFTYTGSAKRARHTAAVVVWNDPADMYRQATEYVDDPEGIRRYGFNPVTVNAFGCTSRGQAHRFGRWTLYSELYETETCTHRTGLEGAVVRPGEVYKVLDIGRSGLRWGGRVVSAVGAQVTLDSEVSLEAGRQYTVTFVTPSTPPTLATVNLAPVGDNATTAVLSLAEVPAEVPAAGTPWVLECPDYIEAQLFRCVAVNENGPGEFEVVGLKHHPGKYALVEEGILFDEAPISGQLPASTIILPTGVQMTQDKRVNSAGVLETHLYLSWDVVQQASIQGYEAEYSVDGGTWVKLSAVADNKVEIRNPVPGLYSARVRSINVFGAPSAWVAAGATVTPPSDIPPDVTGLQLLGQGNDQTFVDRDARFSWNRLVPSTGSDLDDGTYGVGGSYPAGWLAGYVVKIYSGTGTGGTLRRTDFTPSEEYTYSYDKNCLDGGGAPIRRFTIEVYAKTSTGTLSSSPARLSVSNPAPQMLV